MGTYNIPRNTKGEGRILYIFSTKALIYTVIGIVIGLPMYFILTALGFQVAGLIVTGVIGFIGFSIATFKFPEIPALKVSKIVGGEKIDDIIKRYFKFKKKGKVIYINTEEERKNG